MIDVKEGVMGYLVSALTPLLSLPRCSLMGYDLNRHWHDPSPMAHPTLYATKQLVMEYDKDPVRQTQQRRNSETKNKPQHWQSNSSNNSFLYASRIQNWTSTSTSMHILFLQMVSHCMMPHPLVCKLTMMI